MFIKDYEAEHNFEDIGKKTLLLNARKMKIKNLEPLILISIKDITQRKKDEEHKKELLEKEQELTQELNATNEELQTTMEEIYYFFD